MEQNAGDEKHHAVEDIRFVREALARDRRRDGTPAIPLLWAAICLVGFTLVDIRPTAVPGFFAIAAPVGFIASALIGYLSERANGSISSAKGRAELGHWGLLLGSLVLLAPFPAAAGISGGAIAQIYLLVVAIAYGYYAFHTDPAYWSAAALMTAGYLLPFVLAQWTWTIIGVSVAGGLVASAFLAYRAQKGGESGRSVL